MYNLLESLYLTYCKADFIATDPICIPHLFVKKEDIEIAGFLTATLAWGQRVTIIKKGRDLMERMDNAPFDFIINATAKNISSIDSFVHRTFQGDDCIFFMHALKQIYKKEGGLETAFTSGYNINQSIKESIHQFRELFFGFEHLHRTRKHVPDPMTGSAAKRINMYLRWMVRNDGNGVDFGIWKNINPAHLMCPLDLHSGRVARQLGLLTRKQDDWQAVEELTSNLLTFDASDPVKYDFALFGAGVNEKFITKTTPYGIK
jgi:uncharacterized protein (TIGR02757 family)